MRTEWKFMQIAAAPASSLQTDHGGRGNCILIFHVEGVKKKKREREKKAKCKICDGCFYRTHGEVRDRAQVETDTQRRAH